MSDLLPRLSLERALQVALASFVFTAVLAGGAILSLLGPAGAARWPILAVVLVLAAGWAWRRRTDVPDAALAVPAFLVVLAAVSAAWSSLPLTTFAHAAAFGAVVAVAVLLAHATAGRADGAEAVAAAIVAAAAAVALAGVLVLAVRYDRAVQPATTVSPARYQGLGGGPNMATMLFGVAAPLAAYFALWARAAALRVLAALALGGLLVSIAFSGSRGALAAAFAGLFVFALAGFRPRRVVAAAGATALLLAATGGLASIPSRAATNPPQPTGVDPNPPGVTPSPGYIDANVSGVRLQDDIGHPGPGKADTTLRVRTLVGSSGRFEAWAGALGQVGERPIAGYGFGTEDKVFQDRYVFFNSNVPENSYIGLLLQLGLVGLVVFVALPVVAAVRVARRMPRLDPRSRAIAAACAGSLAAGLVLALFQSYVYAPGNNAALPFWVAALLLIALTARAPARGR